MFDKQKQLERRFEVGQHIRVNLLPTGRIEEAVIRAIVERADGPSLRVDFGEQTALIRAWQVLSD